jgi:hypothetical protein
MMALTMNASFKLHACIAAQHACLLIRAVRLSRNRLHGCTSIECFMDEMLRSAPDFSNAFHFFQCAVRQCDAIASADEYTS